jgi:hypothetical protein
MLTFYFTVPVTHIKNNSDSLRAFVENVQVRASIRTRTHMCLLSIIIQFLNKIHCYQTLIISNKRLYITLRGEMAFYALLIIRMPDISECLYIPDTFSLGIPQLAAANRAARRVSDGGYVQRQRVFLCHVVRLQWP